MIFSKKPILGVDLGSRNLKGVQLKKDKKGKVSLAAHFFQDLALTTHTYPSNCKRDEALKAALEIQSLSSRNVAATVKDSELLTFNLELPTMSEKEMEKIVPLEVTELGQLRMDEHTFDFIVHPKFVKAYCVKNTTVLKQIRILESAGLNPKTIESEMMAINTMLKFNDYIGNKKAVVVFDLGENQINSALICDGLLTLTRSNETSFGQANLALKESCNLSHKEAEGLIQKYDFLLGPGEEKNAANTILDDLFTEIFKTIKTDLELYQDYGDVVTPLDEVLLVGGGSQMKSAAKIIEKFLKVPATVVNPFRNIDIFGTNESSTEIGELAPYMGMAVGLALAAFEKGKAA